MYSQGTIMKYLLDNWEQKLAVSTDQPMSTNCSSLVPLWLKQHIFPSIHFLFHGRQAFVCSQDAF